MSRRIGPGARAVGVCLAGAEPDELINAVTAAARGGSGHGSRPAACAEPWSIAPPGRCPARYDAGSTDTLWRTGDGSDVGRMDRKGLLGQR